MARTNNACGLFAILVGVFLLVEGIWGLSSPVVFGVLSTNTLHAIIHIVLGVIGIGTGLRGGARRYCMFLGILLLAVGGLWFVPGASKLVVSLFNVNFAVAVLNIVVGAVALALSLRAPAARRR